MTKTIAACLASLVFSLADPLFASGEGAAQRRIGETLAAGQPIVVHVVVALCDNEYQGIVPVPPALGDGDDPARNLYWGALYGVRTHLLRREGYTLIEEWKVPEPHVLRRVLLTTTIEREGKSVPVFLVADAWRGRKIREAIIRYLGMAAGGHVAEIRAVHGEEEIAIRAGGAAHVLAFVGHNGLMDFSVPSPEPAAAAEEGARAAIVLACASERDFGTHLESAGAFPLVQTRGLMAPEAYSLAAALESWIGGASPGETRQATAAAYHRYQKCGARAARRLFGAPEP